MKQRLAALGLMLLVSAVPGNAWSQTATEMDQTLDQLFGAHKPYHDFFVALQAAVKAHDKAAVAAMVDYPIEVHVGGHKVKIHDPAHFEKDYAQIMTQKIVDAVGKQTYPTLFARDQGVMIGDGEVWFSGVGASGHVRITAINN